MRSLAIAIGIVWSVAFVVVGVHYDLQTYADGSLFSYAVAAQDAWAFHWHNISDRLFVYLYAHVPSEAYVRLLRDAHGGVVLYGFLFFVAPLLGLIATYAADRSKGRTLFTFACGSTASLCPLVFGFPTEVWISHALFWPALAVCHYARGGFGTALLVFLTLLALVLTHDGAVLFAGAIVVTLALHGMRRPAFLRTVGIFFLVMAVWSGVKHELPPDDYMAKVLLHAALHVFDISFLYCDLIVLMLGALATYATATFIFHALSGGHAEMERGYINAALIVVVGLVAYWHWWDHAIHADHRYYMRTVLLVATPIFGVLAVIAAQAAEQDLTLPASVLRPLAVIAREATARFLIGALVLVTLIHVVETQKFVAAWTSYTAAVRKLALGAASDPKLGDEGLVSSLRISDDLNRLSWFSTTPYLSVLVSPNLAPRRLVVDPTSNFFWLSCKMAQANTKAERAMPAQTRLMVQREACVHH